MRFDFQTNQLKRWKNAFSLIEVAIASGIVMVFILAVYGCIAVGFRNLQLARESMQATQILTSSSEVFRLYSWSQVTNSVGTNAFVPASYTNFVATAGSSNGITFITTFTVTNAS